MARKITISFKETRKDIELFELLDGMEDKSAEIKALLRQALQTTITTPVTVTQPKKDINILNF